MRGQVIEKAILGAFSTAVCAAVVRHLGWAAFGLFAGGAAFMVVVEIGYLWTARAEWDDVCKSC